MEKIEFLQINYFLLRNINKIGNHAKVVFLVKLADEDMERLREDVFI